MALPETSLTMPPLAPSSVGPSDFESRRHIIVTSRWALILGCAYLILFSEGSSQPTGLMIIAIFLASNFFLGRMEMTGVTPQRFSIGIAVLDTMLIAVSLYLAGQLNVELLVLFLGVLVLSIAGMPLWIIATVTLGMSMTYWAMVWVAGNNSAWQSSTLLRAPFLLGAALAYASLTEQTPGNKPPRTWPSTESALTRDLRQQWDSIQRCQAALAEGSPEAVRATLEEIEIQNQAMRARLGTVSATSAPRVQSVACNQQ